MATVVENIVTEGVSGVIGTSKYCFKQAFGKTVFGKRPVKTAPPTESQLAVQQRFGAASAKTKVDMADPIKKAEWLSKCGKKYKTARGCAFAFYFNEGVEATGEI